MLRPKQTPFTLLLALCIRVLREGAGLTSVTSRFFKLYASIAEDAGAHGLPHPLGDTDVGTDPPSSMRTSQRSPHSTSFQHHSIPTKPRNSPSIRDDDELLGTYQAKCTQRSHGEPAEKRNHRCTDRDRLSLKVEVRSFFLGPLLAQSSLLPL